MLPPPRAAVPLRRALHRLAEPAFCEWQTLDFVAARLKALGYRLSTITEEELLPFEGIIPRTALRYLSHVVPTAPLPFLCATLDVGEGECVAVRAELDALPIAESQDSSHLPARENFSAQGGAMHACGHDGHLAIALEVAEQAIASRDLLRERGIGQLRFLFQGAEEGVRGGAILAGSSLLDGIDRLYCFHLGMGLPRGSACPAPQGFLATVKFALGIRGQAAHAGHPEQGRNAVATLAEVITKGLALASPAERRLVNFAALSAPGTPNQIPGFARCLGEARAQDAKGLAGLCTALGDAVASADARHGTRTDLTTLGHALPITQSPELVDEVRTAALSCNLKVVESHDFSASDDASLLISRVQSEGGKGCYFIVGADLAAPHHSPGFDFGEDALDDGIALLCTLLLG
ncbi:MAG: amidohydrolase [Succinivibrionaceae bacterium]|nr:amidohydrolase [Succinivibrionaceae bacterium]